MDAGELFEVAEQLIDAHARSGFDKDRLRIIARQIGNCVEISRRYLGFFVLSVH